MKVKLTLQSAEIKPNEFNLSKLPAKIGRGKEATLRLIHPQVSRLHCELFEEAGELRVRDLASLNGTFVDEERVDDFVAVPSGAKLMIGSIEFQVLCGDDVDRLLPPDDALAGDAAVPAEAAEPIAELEMADDQDEAGAAPADDTGTVDLDWLLAPDGASGAAVASGAAMPSPALNPAAAKNVAAAKPQPDAVKPAQAVQPLAAGPKPAAPPSRQRLSRQCRSRQ